MRIQLIVAPIAVAVAACSGGEAGGGTCTGDLATVGEYCPASYDGTEASLPMCPPVEVGFPVVDRSVWQCQDLSILYFWSGLGGLACYYDATSHALVGAEHHTDVHCAPPQLGIEAGRTNPRCRENAPRFSRVCSAP
jgi:hypothetical protein